MAGLSLVFVVFVALTHTSPAYGQDNPTSNPRIDAPDLRRLVDAGVAGSPSLRTAIRQLDESDVIAFASTGVIPYPLNGQLRFVSMVSDRRYLKIELAWHLSGIRKLATLGHELQHAIEIAHRPSIVDAASMALAFREIGFSRGAPTASRHDTAAARDAGNRVWLELSAARSTEY